MILGMFPVNSVPATVLFDSGATHSFLSMSFAGNHGMEIEDLRCPLMVSTPVIMHSHHNIAPLSE